jgi:hypothetical protein
MAVAYCFRIFALDASAYILISVQHTIPANLISSQQTAENPAHLLDDFLFLRDA